MNKENLKLRSTSFPSARKMKRGSFLAFWRGKWDGSKFNKGYQQRDNGIRTSVMTSKCADRLREFVLKLQTELDRQNADIISEAIIIMNKYNTKLSEAEAPYTGQDDAAIKLSRLNRNKNIEELYNKMIKYSAVLKQNQNTAEARRSEAMNGLQYKLEVYFRGMAKVSHMTIRVEDNANFRNILNASEYNKLLGPIKFSDENAEKFINFVERLSEE